MKQVLRGNIIHAPEMGRLEILEHGCMVLEDGVIIERGNHDQLLALKGRYYELYTGKKELD